MTFRIYNILVTFMLCFPLIAGPSSIAHKGWVTTSSELESTFSASNIIDGILAVKGKGGWLAEKRNAWIQINWDKQQSINRIVIYNSPYDQGQITKGVLLFDDGSKIDVNLPSDGSPKALDLSTKKTKFIRFIPISGMGDHYGLSEIEVFPSYEQYNDYVSWVDPYIETNKGRFFYFITGSRPFGVISAAPMTLNRNNGGGGYAHKSKEILGFPQVKSWTLSGICMMPTTSDIDPVLGEENWKSSFIHDDEIVQPGYHRVYLSDHKTWVEQTATDRVSFYRFTWTRDTVAQILVNLGGVLGNSKMADADVIKINETEYIGSVSSVDRAYNVGPIDVKLFFIVQFNKPWQSLHAWKDSINYQNINSIKGENAGVSSHFNVKAGDQILMKISVSYTNIENARNNLLVECNHWDFEKVKSETKNIWNEWLGKIDVEGGSVAQRIKFYTDLWHVLLGRQRINDVSGDYPDRTEGSRFGQHGYLTDAKFKIKNPGKKSDGSIRHNMYNSDAFWLTQWNLNVLWGLAWPEIQDDMATSMITYANNGGLLPRGPAGGGYTYIMTGSPSTNLIVSAFMKDILTKHNSENAYQMIKKNLFPGGMLGGGEFFKHDLEFYIENGWWPNNAGINIEASFQDWGAAQMAKKLGKIDEYQYFMKRSDSWKKCYNFEQKLLFPVDHNGNFTHTDPFHHWGYVEANAWQATWGVSHDIPGLAKLMGGNDELVKKLNEAFENGKKDDFVYSYSKGHVSYANQPGCSNAHVFSYANAPWLTQYWVRQVKEHAYGGITPDLGYGGHDEDQGQMGGVSALMAIGLFNIVGTESISPFYEITSPVFDKVTIKLDRKYYKGDEFVIKIYNNSKENCFIQKAKLNGKSLDNFWFLHEYFAAGGELEIWLGNKPNKKWGIKDFPPVNVQKEN